MILSNTQRKVFDSGLSWLVSIDNMALKVWVRVWRAPADQVPACWNEELNQGDVNGGRTRGS